MPPAAHAAVARALERAEATPSLAGATNWTASATAHDARADRPLRFAVAEGDGSYLCPACGRQDWVPLTIDLD